MGRLETLAFVVVNAFTTSTFGGNPAAVVFLDRVLPTETLLNISKNLNQPITSFVLPPNSESTEELSRTFSMRWFTQTHEISLCGHGTLAAASALFHKPELVPTTVKLLNFETRHGIVTARLTPGGRVEIEMPSSDVVPVTEGEVSKIMGVLEKAFRRNDVMVKFIGAGTGPRSEYLLIELDEKENLASMQVDTSALAGTLPYGVNIITSKSSNHGVTYETRMFAPAFGVSEDHVCGSANCLLGPYWAKKTSVKSDAEMFVKQVSARGGNIWVTVDEERQVVKLKGEVKLVAKGEFYLD